MDDVSRNAPPPLPPRPAKGARAWLLLHGPVVLYAWFWFGMFLCGLLAPPERVAGLDSALVSEGWHLSLMSCVLGLPVLLLYRRRMAAEPAAGESSDSA
jgi:hypothetical protein